MYPRNTYIKARIRFWKVILKWSLPAAVAEMDVVAATFPATSAYCPATVSVLPQLKPYLNKDKIMQMMVHRSCMVNVLGI